MRIKNAVTKIFVSITLLSFVVVAGTPLTAGAQGPVQSNQTYQQSVFGNLPTYSGNAVQSSATTGNTGGSCGNLTTTGLSGIVGCIIGIFNSLVYLMMAAAVVFVVWGAFQMIYSEEKREAGRQRIYNGIIGLFVMISVWGFVNILNRTFNLTGNPIAPPPLVAQ